MTPQQVMAEKLHENTYVSMAENISHGLVAALNAAGYIIVPKGSIGRAQKDAYYDALEDVRMGFVKAA